MSRNVRNFWIETTIDGRKSRMSGGPVRKDGGFECTVKIRANGCVKDAISIRGYVAEDGKTLRL